MLRSTRCVCGRLRLWYSGQWRRLVWRQWHRLIWGRCIGLARWQCSRLSWVARPRFIVAGVRQTFGDRRCFNERRQLASFPRRTIVVRVNLTTRRTPTACTASLPLHSLLSHKHVVIHCHTVIHCHAVIHSHTVIHSGKYAQFELPGNFTKLTYNDSISD